MTEDKMTQDKYTVLKQLYGYDSFREGQERMIDDILSHRDCFAVMPTGAGKSVCYQIPALLLPGITLVISPLISLMKDQVMALKQLGVPAAYLNSSLTPRQFDLALDNAFRGMYKIIYVAPERLVTPRFVEFSYCSDISLVAVDEAHCVSQWGQDFRPSYLNIADYIDRLPERPAVAAFTATATDAVREDIVRYLRLSSPDILITGFDRPNLYYGVETPGKKYDALLTYVRERPDEHGIVYCSTRKTVDEVCDNLIADGVSAAKYHAGLPDADRRTAQEDFTYDRVQVIVATNAFGMGIDKSDVRFVVHYNMPKDLESYYQEAGRAGRDGAAAECLLFYSPQDTHVAKYLIENGEIDTGIDQETAAKVRERDLLRLDKMVGYCMTPQCLRGYILGYFGEKTAPGGCGNCSNCRGSAKALGVADEAGKVMRFVEAHTERYGFSIGPKNIADALKGRETDDISRLGLASNPYFGALDYMPTERIRRVIDLLVYQGALKYSEGKYRTIELTGRKAAAESLYIKDDGRESRQSDRRREKPKGQIRRQDYDDSMAGDDSELYGRLRALRKRLADTRGVPPYVIFSDKTLLEIVKRRPKDRFDMLECSGVGERKLELYGDIFLKEVNR